LLGVGWSLSGLSAITRCPQTTAQDNNIHGVDFSANDRFCLDGQRLVPEDGNYSDYGASGKEYRTEINSFSKIISYGSAGTGPAWFKVWTKDGKIIEFGDTADSFIEAIQISDGLPKNQARVWAARKISDTTGNYMEFVYEEDQLNGAYRVNRVNYSGVTVTFSYSERQDKVFRNYAGTKTSILKRLSSISISNASGSVQSYDLSYELSAVSSISLVSSIRFCGGATCFQGIVFNWISEVVETGKFNANYSITGNNHFGSTWHPYVTDVTGDGVVDVVRVRESGDMAVFVGNGDGTFNPNYQLTGNNPLGAEWHSFVVDATGDGLADVVRVREQGDIYVFIGNGDGTFDSNYQSTANNHFGSTWHRNVVDVTGDGLADIVRVRESGDIAVFLSQAIAANLIESVTNSLNGLLKPTFKPITSASVYTKGISANTPSEYDYQAPMYVVSQVQMDDGIGGQRVLVKSGVWILIQLLPDCPSSPRFHL